MRHTRRAIVLFFVVLCVAGCDRVTAIGTNFGDAGARDAAAPARTDECGNGTDDDRDGRIDEGCPCGPGETQACFSGSVAANDVGICRAGIQRCVAVGVEWGDWGDSACTGERLPAATEACDGADDDCDGAIDEGCPCTEGETSPCGAEFVLTPCMPGAQTCRGGAWGTCEGAIVPTADVCGDGIDNDCDGVTDELCGCVPEPERCRDGIDNDCDGAIDEPACTPDWPADAGTPDCSAVLEACGDAYDNDCDGATDEGCAPACGESSVGPVQSAEMESPTNLFGSPWTLGVAWSADAAELGVVYVWQESSGSTLIAEEVRLLRFGADATLRGQTVLARTPGAYPNRLGGLAWNGERWIATWSGHPTTGDRGIARIYASLALADGRPVGAPVALTSGVRPAEHPRVLAVGRDLYFAWAEIAPGGVEPSNVHAAHYDGDLGAIEADIVLGPGTGWIDLAWSGDALGVLDVSSVRDAFVTTARFTLLRDDAIVAQDQQVVSADSADLRPPALAFGGGGFLGCWPGTADPFVSAPVRCAHIDAAGAFLGPAFDTTRPASLLLGDVAWNGCRFVVYSARRDARAGYEQYVAIVGPAGGVVESSSTLPYPHTTPSPRETHVVAADAGSVLLIEWSRGGSTRPDVLDLQVVD